MIGLTLLKHVRQILTQTCGCKVTCVSNETVLISVTMFTTQTVRCVPLMRCVCNSLTIQPLSDLILISHYSFL